MIRFLKSIHLSVFIYYFMKSDINVPIIQDEIVHHKRCLMEEKSPLEDFRRVNFERENTNSSNMSTAQSFENKMCQVAMILDASTVPEPERKRFTARWLLNFKDVNKIYEQTFRVSVVPSYVHVIAKDESDYSILSQNFG
ncbi:hypothetical protein ROZALSC1DRAFT_26210 [Rozella allomycis CSF55]|uniref:Uncharacterized protein n=1 Tax=Rozella allomycis (strain CSF55) TaxID=988480 RepID=A0A4P9Y8Z9_ROZAC|nr:hypothetical protein ROZALSC1DRAFT_26210 [Rozella allomycis CSF55]